MIFTSKMCEKNLWKSDILSKDAGRMSLSTGVFTHFARKNQLPGFSIIGTLTGNGLNCRHISKIKGKHDFMH